MLLPWLLGWEQPAERTAFAAGLHAGSCLGIAWALRDDLRSLSAREIAVLLAVSAPAAAAGALAADVVEERLGRPPQLAALLAGAGALMWWVDARAARTRPRPTHGGPGPAAVPRHGHPGADRSRMSATRDRSRGWRVASVDPAAAAAGLQVHPTAAAAAALAQVTALAPGISRSGATLTALRAVGVDRGTARRFSLLMSLPLTAGAAAVSLARADRGVLRELGPGLAAGGVAAAVAGAAAATVQRRRPDRPLAGAALYRLGLAAVVAHRLMRKGAP